MNKRISDDIPKVMIDGSANSIIFVKYSMTGIIDNTKTINEWNKYSL